MTRHYWIAAAVFLATGTIVHQPGTNSLETGAIAALAAAVYLVVVMTARSRM